jgi:hypothetical protein
MTTMVDTRKYLLPESIRPDDLRDGPRTEQIKTVSEHEKFGCLVLGFESGEQLNLNNFHLRALNKAWGWETESWIGLIVELSIGSYVDRKSGEDRETAVLKTISPAATGKALKPLADELADEIPF